MERSTAELTRMARKATNRVSAYLTDEQDAAASRATPGTATSTNGGTARV